MENVLKKDTLRSDVVVNIIRTVVLTILSFVTFPYVCRILTETSSGTNALGLYTWANTFVYYFVILARIGIPNLAVRECVKVRNDRKALSKKAQEFFILQGITTILSFGLMVSIIFLVGGDLASNSSLIFLLSINFIVGVFSFEWIFIALEKQFYLALRSIIVLTLCSILVFIFVRYPNHYYLYAFFSILGTTLYIICNLFYLPKFISLKKEGKYNFKQYFKPLIILFFISLVLTLYDKTDTFMLGYLDPAKNEVASYAVGIKAIEVVIGIIAALGMVFMPKATRYYSLEDKSYFKRLTKYSINICLFIVLPAIASMCILSEPITILISGSNSTSSAYQSASYVLISLASMMLTFSLANIIYTQVLIPMNKEKVYLWTILIGVILNISLSLLFALLVFKSTPAIGVAIGTAITDGLIFIYLLVKTWKYVGRAIFNWNSLKIFVACLIIALSGYFIRQGFVNCFSSSSQTISLVLQLVLTVLIEAIIYIVFLLIVKEDLVRSFVKKKIVTINS